MRHAGTWTPINSQQHGTFYHHFIGHHVRQLSIQNLHHIHYDPIQYEIRDIEPIWRILMGRMLIQKHVFIDQQHVTSHHHSIGCKSIGSTSIGFKLIG